MTWFNRMYNFELCVDTAGKNT